MGLLERRRSRDCGSEREGAEGAGPSFEVNAGECAMRLAPGKGFPEGFLATALEASPVSSPYEQRLAIGGVSRGDGSAGASTAIFLASVNPRNSRRRVVADASGGSEELAAGHAEEASLLAKLAESSAKTALTLSYF